MDIDQIMTALHGADAVFVDQVRVAALTEQERQAKLAQLPDDLAIMARDAAEAGCDPDELRARVDAALNA